MRGSDVGWQALAQLRCRGAMPDGISYLARGIWDIPRGDLLVRNVWVGLANPNPALACVWGDVASAGTMVRGQLGHVPSDISKVRRHLGQVPGDGNNVLWA